MRHRSSVLSSLPGFLPEGPSFPRGIHGGRGVVAGRDLVHKSSALNQAALSLPRSPTGTLTAREAGSHSGKEPRGCSCSARCSLRLPPGLGASEEPVLFSPWSTGQLSGPLSIAQPPGSTVFRVNAHKWRRQEKVTTKHGGRGERKAKLHET